MEEKIEIFRIDDGVSFKCKDKEDAVEAIIEEYKANDICVGELMDGLIIHGLSIQDIVDVFAAVMYRIEEDRVVQYMEDDEVNRWEW